MNRRWWLLAALCLTAAPLASAQAYPNKPVKIIVTFPPGGTPDIYGRVLAQLAVPRDVFRRQRLFQPCQVKRRECGCPTHHLGSVKALVGVGHQLEPGANRLAHRGQPGHIFTDMRPANLDLGALEALGLGCQGLRYQFVSTQMQPTAFGGVNRYPALCATQQLPQGQGLAGAQFDDGRGFAGC